MSTFWICFTATAATLLGLVLSGMPGLRIKGEASASPDPDKGKFCRDCRWMSAARVPPLFRPDFTFAKCMHVTSVRYAGEVLVSGRRRRNNQHYCSVMRAANYSTDCCGQEGKYWEPIE